MQETHSVQDDLLNWQNEWESQLFLNHGCSNSRGTLIAYSADFNFKMQNYTSDNDGRIQLCSIEHNDKKFLLINIYDENSEQKQIVLLKN